LVVGAVGAVAAVAGFKGRRPPGSTDFPGADLVGPPVAGVPPLATEPAFGGPEFLPAGLALPVECPLALGAGALSATGFAAGLTTREVPGPHLAAPLLAGTGGIGPLATAGPVAAVAEPGAAEPAVGERATGERATGRRAAGEPEAAGLEQPVFTVLEVADIL
jgi:hypothetical protein